MRKHVKKIRKEKNKKTETTTTNWFDEQEKESVIRTQHKNSSGELSHNRNTLWFDDDVRTGRRPGETNKRSSKIRTSTNRGNKPGKTKALEKGVGNTKLTAEIQLTMQEIRDSLTDDDLQDLINNQFIPNKLITFHKKYIKSSFDEDTFINVSKIKRRKKIKRKNIKPSERYRNKINKYKETGESDAETVLGIYFSMYKHYFNEEDPDSNNKSIRNAIIQIEYMADEVTNGDYEKIIKFTKKLFPLWIQRLRKGDRFPRNRPTINSLYGGSRHFWANRFLYFKRWQQK
jgi:hypothetical protein